MSRKEEEDQDQAMGYPFLCPEIQHPGQTGCKLSALVREVEELKTAVNGTDQEHPGMILRFTRFIDAYEVRENIRDQAWKGFRWVIGTIIALGMLILGILEVNKQIHAGYIKNPQFFQQKQTGQEYHVLIEYPVLDATK